MCGIVGVFRARPSDDPARDRAIVARMRDAMTHRGPDDAGAWDDADRPGPESSRGRCFLGHRRLSIIDLSPAGHQPMLSAGGDLAICYNGELYNHAELRPSLEASGFRYRGHSDTETMLYALERDGVSALDSFNGMFGVALYDRRDALRPRLHLIRDRVGIKPVYLTRTPRGDWLFASEIKALMEHPDVPREMSPAALWHYLTFIVAPAPMTMFRGVWKVPAGWRVEIDHEGRASAHRWYDAVPDRAGVLSERDLSEAEAEEELLRLLRASVKRRMVADVPFGVLLSGGVDSSMNVALMSELMDRPVTTFSIGYEGQEAHNEFAFARRVSERYATEHHETLIDGERVLDFLPTLIRTQEEPIADNVCIPLYFLSHLVKQRGTTVVQVGEGADENWLGYWWCEHYRRKQAEVYDPARARVPRSALARLVARWKRVRHPHESREDRDIARRAELGQHLFWGGAACWTGELRASLTPDPAGFAEEVACPVEGLLPPSFAAADSHAVVEHYLGPLRGRLPAPEVLHAIPYMEHRLRLPEHLLMRVDKFTMAHAVEARVPFLDHTVVEFARRCPVSYKLAGGVGKRLVKRIAERFLPEDIVYRTKQGFGAPMEAWFKEPGFVSMTEGLLERSPLIARGLIDRDVITGMFAGQVEGRGGWSFHLWTVLNACLWHQTWIEGGRAEPARAPALAASR